MPSLHSQFSPSFCRIACCGLEKKASPTEQDATLAPSLVYSSLLKGHRSAIDDIPCMSHQPCQGGFVGLQSPLVEASSNQFCPGSPSREAFSTISTSGIAVRTSQSTAKIAGSLSLRAIPRLYRRPRTQPTKQDFAWQLRPLRRRVVPAKCPDARPIAAMLGRSVVCLPLALSVHRIGQPMPNAAVPGLLHSRVLTPISVTCMSTTNMIVSFHLSGRPNLHPVRLVFAKLHRPPHHEDVPASRIHIPRESPRERVCFYIS